MFNNDDDFKKIVDRLNIDDKPDDTHRKNLRREMLSVFSKSSTKTTHRQQTITRTITKNLIIKFAAAAAVIIIVSLIGVIVFTQNPEAEIVKQTDTPAAQVTKDTAAGKSVSAEQQLLDKIKKLIAAGDVEALAAIFAQAKPKDRELIAQYLAGAGGSQLLAALEKLKEPNQPEETQVTLKIKPEEEQQQEQETFDGILDFQVIDKETSEPIPDVTVMVSVGQVGTNYTTDKDGRARIEIGLPVPDYVHLAASKNGFVATAVRFSSGGVKMPKSYTLELEKAIRIGGFVQDEDGLPIEGAVIYFRDFGVFGRGRHVGSFMWQKSTRTDVDGRWSFDMVGEDLSSLMLFLKHNDYISDDFIGSRPLPPKEELLDLSAVMVMKKGCQVTGTVSDVHGNPIEQAKVYLGERRETTLFMNTKTDQQGWFSFGAKAGMATLTAKAEGYATELQRVMVTEDMNEVEFRLSPNHGIRGRVVDINDNPLADVSVQTVSWKGIESFKLRTKTDSDGYFQWDNAPKDEVGFRIYKAGYMQIDNRPLIASEEEYLITMYKPLSISGKVVDAESGEPVKNFELIPGFQWQGSSQITWQRNHALKLAGGFYEKTFTYPCNGYSVRIEAEGFKPAVSRLFTSDEESVTFDFELEKGDQITGTVFLPDGSPASNASVAISLPSQGVYVRNGNFERTWGYKFVITDANGRFSLPLQDDTFTLAIIHNAGYAEVAEDQLAANSDIILEPWSRVEGTLWTSDSTTAGQEIELQHISRYDPKIPHVNWQCQTSTDPNDSFFFDRVVQGKSQVSKVIRLSQHRTTPTLTTTINVPAGETVIVDLGGTGRAVIGKVKAPADYKKPVDFSYSRNNLWSKDSEQGLSYGFKIAPDGTFRIENVTLGNYVLQINLHEPIKDRWGNLNGNIIGRMQYQLEMPEDTSDEPFDIGTLELKMINLNVGDIAPEFEAKTFDGQDIRLADFRGKVVTLVFWEGQNLPNAEHISQIKQFYNMFSDNPRFAMIMVFVEVINQADKEFFQNNDLEWTTCYLAGQARSKFYNDYGRNGMPSGMVIGTDGRILARDVQGEKLISIVQNALAQ